VLRACSMTLVVMAEETDDASALGETIAALMPEHPARTILVRFRKADGHELAGRVFAQCWMPFGQRRQICCEQIEITASEAALRDVESVLGPVAAPDLPLIVWCRSSRVARQAEFWEFASTADKVVVDTDAWPDAKSSIQRLASLTSRGIALGDFAWTRLTRWREMLSRVFENTQYAERLSEISRVRVRYDEATQPVMARYMGSWLVNSLRETGVPTDLSLEPGSAVLSVELGGSGLRVELVRRGDRLVTTVDQLSECTSLSQPTDYLLLREELGIVRRDPVFERTLAAAARL